MVKVKLYQVSDAEQSGDEEMGLAFDVLAIVGGCGSGE
jgi:hypothetical protein